MGVIKTLALIFSTYPKHNIRHKRVKTCEPTSRATLSHLDPENARECCEEMCVQALNRVAPSCAGEMMSCSWRCSNASTLARSSCISFMVWANTSLPNSAPQ